MAKAWIIFHYREAISSTETLSKADQEICLTGGSCKSIFLPHNRHSGQAKRDPESRVFKQFWIPAFAGMTE
jgi:hypothetical protein